MINNPAIQNIIILMTFVILYQLLYRWNRQFLKNRLFLISAVILSIVIPFLHFDMFPQHIIIEKTQFNNTLAQPILNTTASETNYIFNIYMIGIILSVTFFLYRLIRIIVKIKLTNFDEINTYNISYNHDQSYSFLHYIFIKSNAKDIELTHEKAHVDQQHTTDKIFLELCLCLLWFNPFIYIIKYYISENHEFEVDHLITKSKDQNKIGLAETLLLQVKTNNNLLIPITNEFNSLTKNRLKMLAKKNFKSNLVYLLMLPIVFGIFSAFTFKTYPVYQTIGNTIVLDTIPGTITTIDTISVYDYETHKEFVEIVKTETSLENYLKEIKRSGKTYTMIDTVATYHFDTKTETEGFYKTTIPMEFENAFKMVDYNQQDAIIKEYGNTKEIK